MLATICIGLLAMPAPGPGGRDLPEFARPDDPDLDAKIAAAGKDVAKLLELAAACLTAQREESARKVFLRVLELDSSNEAAHRGLQHQFYDGKWFEGFAELARYKREEEARMKAKGLARFKQGWVPEADVPFLAMQWIKDEQGIWRNPLEVAREKQAAEWKAAGYLFRADDSSWVAPDEQDKWAALRWKCGADWLDLAAANDYHSRIEQPWVLAGEHFDVWATCDWEGANIARWHADRIHAELVRIFGLAPTGKPHIVVLNSLPQYNQAAGNQGTLWETEGLSSLHGAYFADAYFDLKAKPPQYLGCGVCYWDRKDPKVAAWGPYWLRWAAAQSFVDALDPSWGQVSAWIANMGHDDLETFPRPFWGEKKIPRWLRYGAASYVEQFLRDPETAADGDPWRLRKFAFSELAQAGKLRKLEEVFAFKLDTSNIPDSSRLYREAGLVVAYLLDGAGGDEELRQRHADFQTALRSGSRSAIQSAATSLQQALAGREKEIARFAGL